MMRVLALLFLLAAPTQQQEHPLVGTWKITYPWHIDVVNGVVKPVMETGELRVQARGDSLTAEVVRNGARTIRIAARKGAEETVFVARDSVTLTTPSGARPMIAVSTWILKVSGDRLSGSLQRRLEGAGGPDVGPQPLSGQRLESSVRSIGIRSIQNVRRG